jgi:hypothetical protein
MPIIQRDDLLIRSIVFEYLVTECIGGSHKGRITARDSGGRLNDQ